ncbi:ABC transporter ATP-binding protein [Nakamurella aerolata]|uniref:ABC transporter ATP-binding protein n=1 Tax=Nakamurella aerolata TaxID=1656892 RepID=A0A849ABA4_9ACTN|nr:ABC transporter ATP-binding protein [Nakamurella aerolata]NNG35760.1 ABC transporter ATP-binding protein [Nakamurella aerolata]
MTRSTGSGRDAAPQRTSAPAAADGADRPLLVVDDLHVQFRTEAGTAYAVDGVSFTVAPGEVLGVVGESGSGKSVTSMSLFGLIDTPPGKITKGSVKLNGRELIGAKERVLRKVRGGEVGVVFQDPMTALDPVIKVGRQIGEAVRVHHKVSRAQAMQRAVELLQQVGVPQPEVRANQYPHEFSGGMRQRAMIAMAIANNPVLLIADEPTTALDVTIQAQVLDIIRKAQQETGAATLFITHDLGVIAELAERVMVMYGGRVMETGSVKEIFTRPRHPYTAGLLASLPSLTRDEAELTPIPGSPPNVLSQNPGCPFQPRCSVGRDRDICRAQRPPLAEVGPGHFSACHFPDETPQPRACVLEEAAVGAAAAPETGGAATDLKEHS